ncbi:hypothetical protein C3L33_06734, partial [Rhododendron williamsianum]
MAAAQEDVEMVERKHQKKTQAKKMKGKETEFPWKGTRFIYHSQVCRYSGNVPFLAYEIPPHLKSSFLRSILSLTI